MRRWCDLVGLVMAAGLASCSSRPGNAASDQQEIEALYNQFSAAVKARNVDAIMTLYAPDAGLVAFDAFPPRQYVGAPSYRKAYEVFFQAYPGPVTSEISDLHITADGTLAFVSSIDR